MTAPTRCPSCSAALAPGAAWCSLCHADLRPKLEPALRSLDVVPGSPSAAAGGTATAVATVAPELAPGSDPVLEPALTAYLEDDRVADDPPVRGRHSRVDEDAAPAPRASRSGRHGHGRGSKASPGRRTRTASALALDPVELEGRALDADDVDALADQMLSRLAVSEKRQHFFDPDDVPGGKPVFIAGAAVSVVLVLVFLFTLFGFLFGKH